MRFIKRHEDEIFSSGICVDVFDLAKEHEWRCESNSNICCSGVANVWKVNFLAYLFGATAIPTAPTTLYIAAFTVMPADDGTGGTEVTIGQGGYARIAVTNNTTNFPVPTAANPTTTSLAVSFSFPTATADWSSGANIVGFGLYTAASGGTFVGSAYALTAIGIADVSTTTGLFTFSAVHGRTTNDAVGMFESAGSNASLPTGFGPYNTNKYYVIATGLTTTAYELSATQGGSAIVPTTTGVGALFVGQSFVAPVLNNSTLTFPANALQFSMTGR
jgi:hypothetical protein